MADINLVTNTTLTPSRWAGRVQTPYLVELDVDLVDVIAAKGSALAASDVIQAMPVPAGTIVLAAGFEKTGVHAGTSTDATVTVQVGDEAYTAAEAFTTDSVGTYTVAVAPTADQMTAVATAGTVDLVLSAFTGTLTEGKVRMYALMLDVATHPAGGIAQMGS